MITSDRIKRSHSKLWATRPLFPSPNIDYSFQVSLVPGKSPQISGNHDGIPAYAITVVDQKGNVVASYQYTPSNVWWEPVRLFDNLWEEQVTVEK